MLAGCITAALLSACTSTAVPGGAPNVAIRAGVAAEDITPLWPVYEMTTELLVAKHYRRLEIQALAIRSGDVPVVIVTADICMFCTEISELVYERVKHLGLGRGQIVLNASHNHSAPAICPNDVLDIGERPIAPYQEFLVQKVVSAIERAFQDLKPASLATSESTVDICINRDGPPHTPGGIIPNPGGLIDRRVRVLQVKDPAGRRLRAALVLFACHPSDVQVGADKEAAAYGADYFGFARDEVARHYPGVTVLTAQGAGGDIRIAHFKNGDITQGFTGSILPNVAPNREFGRRFGEAIVRALEGPASSVQGPLYSAVSSVMLPVEAPAPQEYVARVARGETAPKNHPRLRDDPWYWKWGNWMLEKYQRGDPIPETAGPFEIRMMRFGDDFNLAALDGEIQICVAKQIEQRLAPQRTYVLGYTNNIKAYIPCAENFAPPQNGGNYEINVFYWWMWQTARFKPRVDSVIVDEAVALAGELRHD